ncbi:hypothetical protein [Streptomyces sp. CC77]|uniref:hypothetical protein n=1 Tax=Streptomyces sp. CC77 TaxID=1906739 RepID=UPI0008DD3BA4|nr:hypothetical protein [Streptomyces sp. CC77]OII67080.1 hypothetical protein BJP39_07405 [Streptomyces sp. CC77]
MSIVTDGGAARIHWQQQAAVAVAVLAAVPALGWAAGTDLLQILLPCAAAVAAPLSLGRYPAAFRAACLITGTTLLALAFPLAILGLFLLVPSAVLLLLAPAAHPERRSPAGTAAAVAAVLAATALTLAAAWFLIPE